MKSAIPFTKYASALGATAALSTSAVLFAPAAQASGFVELDFNRSSLLINGDTSSGVELDPYQLDERAGQLIDGEKFSTKLGNIGDIWKNHGITITGLNKAGDELNTSSLGLFNSNCKPRNGTSDSGFTAFCEKNGYGDNDLATGKGSYRNVVYDTNPQGNLLIFEENAGNGKPDDTAHGGTFNFAIDEGRRWSVDQIGILDDATGKITFTYRDGSSLVKDFNIDGENELQFFGDDQQKEIANIAVRLDGSGALTGLRFREIEDAPTIPEPTAVFSLLAVAGVGCRLKRQTETA